MTSMSDSDFSVRRATIDDASAVREIYRPHVEERATSFEIEVPSTEEIARRIAKTLESWEWLVAERDGVVIGYAYGAAHRVREAYLHSVETSVYITKLARRSGVARALYRKLFSALATRGFESAYAGVTLPNDASVAFHESFGFESIGVFPRVGRKFGAWHDVAWFYRPVRIVKDELDGRP